MATKAQIRANRKNAKKSTGPRTNEGKQRSSQNALKHGLLARDAVLPGEDPADFDRQLCDLEDTIEPKNALEFELVRQIVDAQWRLRRLTRLETGYLAAARDKTHRHNKTFRHDDPPEDYDGQTQVLGQSLLERNPGLLHLSRYNGQLSRNLTRALNMIRQLRADEYKYRENRDAKTGGIHRPTVTDPDPYNTPDPYDQPRPARHEPAHTPAAAAAPTRAAPNDQARIGCRPGSGARLRAGSVGIGADVPSVPHASACPPRPRQPEKTNPIPPNLLAINGLEAHSARISRRCLCGRRPQACRGPRRRDVGHPNGLRFNGGTDQAVTKHIAQNTSHGPALSR